MFKQVPLLDVVAEVLVANPSASLAEVAVAAGIGRTTLHKHYATRDELICAVGHRALDLWEQALSGGCPTARAVVAGLQRGHRDPKPMDRWCPFRIE